MGAQIQTCLPESIAKMEDFIHYVQRATNLKKEVTSSTRIRRLRKAAEAVCGSIEEPVCMVDIENTIPRFNQVTRATNKDIIDNIAVELIADFQAVVPGVEKA